MWRYAASFFVNFDWFIRLGNPGEQLPLGKKSRIQIFRALVGRRPSHKQRREVEDPPENDSPHVPPIHPQDFHARVQQKRQRLSWIVEERSAWENLRRPRLHERGHRGRPLRYSDHVSPLSLIITFQKPSWVSRKLNNQNRASTTPKPSWSK